MVGFWSDRDYCFRGVEATRPHTLSLNSLANQGSQKESTVSPAP